MQQLLSALLLFANPAAGEEPPAPPVTEEAPGPSAEAEPEGEAKPETESTPPAKETTEAAPEKPAATAAPNGKAPANADGEAEPKPVAEPEPVVAKALVNKALLTVPIRVEAGGEGLDELSSFLLGYLQRPPAEGETLGQTFADYITAAAAKQPGVLASDPAKVKALEGGTLEAYQNCCSGRGPMTTVADATGATLVAHGSFLRLEEGYVLALALWDTTEAGDPKTGELRAPDLVSFQDQLPSFVAGLFSGADEGQAVTEKGAETVLVVLAPEVSPEPVKLVQQAFDGAVSGAEGYRVAREKLVSTLVPELQVAVNQGCRLPSCRQRMLAALQAEVAMILELNSTGSNMVLTAFRADGSVIGRVQGSCPGCLDKGGASGLNPVVQKLVSDVFKVKKEAASKQVVAKPTTPKKKNRLLDPRRQAPNVQGARSGKMTWKPSVLALTGVTLATATGISAGVMTAMTRREYLAAAERGAGVGEIGALADQGRSQQLTANLGYALAVVGGIASFVMERQPEPKQRRARRIEP